MLDTHTLTTTEIIFQIAVRRQHRVAGGIPTSMLYQSVAILIFRSIGVLVCFAKGIGSGRLFSDLLDLLHSFKVVDLAT